MQRGNLIGGMAVAEDFLLLETCADSQLGWGLYTTVFLSGYGAAIPCRRTFAFRKDLAGDKVRVWPRALESCMASVQLVLCWRGQCSLVLLSLRINRLIFNSTRKLVQKQA